MGKLKIVNIISVILIIVALLLSYMPVETYATTAGTKSQALTTPDEIIKDGQSFIQDGINEGGGEIIAKKSLKEISDTIYNVLLVIGIIIAVIIGMILGIKFIAGSVEEKAEIKGMLVPYIVGCVIIFGAFTIWKVVVDILSAI